jgi:hypothetical protein
MARKTRRGGADRELRGEEPMTTLRQIGEQDATPDIAMVYSEIKTVCGLPMVNLIWRHFAAFPGVLEWAWSTVSPAVRSTAMDPAMRRIVTSIKLPPIVPMDTDSMRAAHITDQARAGISAVVNAYTRGNLINVIALTALRQRLENPDRPAAYLTPNMRSVSRPAELDPLPRIDALDAHLAAQIRALALHHEGADGYVIPSLYLALSYWPGLIETLPSRLSALYEPEAMRAAQANVCDLAEAAARAMLPEYSPPPQGISAVQPALQRFTQVLIPGAIPVCVALRRLFVAGFS